MDSRSAPAHAQVFQDLSVPEGTNTPASLKTLTLKCMFSRTNPIFPLIFISYSPFRGSQSTIGAGSPSLCHLNELLVTVNTPVFPPTADKSKYLSQVLLNLNDSLTVIQTVPADLHKTMATLSMKHFRFRTNVHSKSSQIATESPSHGTKSRGCYTLYYLPL